MKSFVVQKSGNTSNVTIYSYGKIFVTPVDSFILLEPIFSLGENIIKIEYQPNILHFILKENGSTENGDLVYIEYDQYIEKIDNYTNIMPEGKKISLEDAKKIVSGKIYEYAKVKSDLLYDSKYRRYSVLEKCRWSFLLPEAQAFLSTKNIEDAPNLVSQELFRQRIESEADISQNLFIDLLESRANSIVEKSKLFNDELNKISGIRGVLTDEIDQWEVSEEETAIESAQRLLEYNWEERWNLEIQ